VEEKEELSPSLSPPSPPFIPENPPPSLKFSAVGFSSLLIWSPYIYDSSSSYIYKSSLP